MITIENDVISLTLNPQVGGTITKIVHRASGLSVLGNVPWDVLDAPLAIFSARDETEWLTRYTGGWPVLFPNGGDSCTVDGVFHGFHGEASVSPWHVSSGNNEVTLARRFFTVPVEMSRTISLRGEDVIVDEELTMVGMQPVEIMWGHHPTFGSDLLSGPIEITTNADRVVADEIYDPASNPVLPGQTGALASMPGKRGNVDIAHPAPPLAGLLYLEEFKSAWAAIRRLDNAIAIVLSWDENQFPCAWLWLELKGTSTAPWHGRTSLIGIEPNTTRPAYGLAEARARGARLMRLEPQGRYRTRLKLSVFRPDGPIRNRLT